MIQRRTHRFYPTPEQERILARTFGCVRYVYNWGLAKRAAAFQRGERMTHADTDRALTLLKRTEEAAWLNEVSSVPLQQSLRDLQSAYAAFFAKRAMYPSFKRKAARASARYTKPTFTLKGRSLSITKLGNLKVRWDRPLPNAPSSLTIIRSSSGRYYVSFVVEVEVAPKRLTGNSVGIDLGVSRLATLSTGTTVANPKHLQKHSSRLAFLQRKMSRCQQGSKRRNLARRAVARTHERITNARRDALHKLTTALVSDFDVVYLEDLNLRGLAKNHSLARNLSDASIGSLVKMLEYKAEMYGKTVIKVDRWFPSSKMCSNCAYVNSGLTLKDREWACPNCGTHHDRDINAAKNILAVGQTVAAHGDGVRAA